MREPIGRQRQLLGRASQRNGFDGRAKVLCTGLRRYGERGQYADRLSIVIVVVSDMPYASTR